MDEGKSIALPLDKCDSLIFKSDDYWRCYIRHMTQTVYHPVGTCKMGCDIDKESVVNPKLRIRGITGLRVADASITPKIVSANTNPAVIIGERAADFIKKDWNYTTQVAF